MDNNIEGGNPNLGSRIPAQRSLEDLNKDLKEQLDWRKNEEIQRKKLMKKEAFNLAIKLPGQFDVEHLIKSANKIYEELIK